jgi:phosphotransferase system enzyme I (PtsI)
MDAIVSEVTERLGPGHANIFVAQKMMMEDEILLGEFIQVIECERLNAESAVEKTFDTYAVLLDQVEDVYMRERTADINEVRYRLLDMLRESRDETGKMVLLDHRLTFEDNRIVVAEELTPSETILLDTEHTVGFITEKGGRASHAAILARGLGIPAVSGVQNVLGLLRDGTEVLLNGASGEIIIAPSKRTLELYPAIRRVRAPELHAVAPVANLTVLANISRAEEVGSADAVQAEGIGLYRTEFECLSAGRLLTEDEQYDRYAHVAKVMKGRPVFIRLLDFGGDKPASFLDLPREDNPCLGLRGARLLQERVELLIPQVRALARASRHGAISVMYPMIVDLNQFLILRELIRQQIADIDGAALSHGVMFEVPSACLEADDILDAADFGCIGSNDLVQYLFAVDRNNSLVAGDYQPDRPVLWRLIQGIADAARRSGKPLSLCGEIGAQPQYLPRLMACGINTVSVSPRLIGLARRTAAQLPS